MFETRGVGDGGAEAPPFALPDGESLALLESLTPFLEESGGELSDFDLLDVIAGWTRQAAHAEAMVRQWCAVLADRPSMEPLWRSESGTVLDTAADEIGFRLAIGQRSARGLVKEGQALRGVLAEVGEAFSAGLIDSKRARVFVDELEDQSPAVMFAVVDQVLPVAPNLTPTSVRTRIRAVIVQVDPEHAGQREQLAVAKRRVNLPQPIGDGMAFFSAVLPAVEAMTLYQVCEATARAGRADGDGRNLEQLRADALVGLAERALSEGCVLPAIDVRVGLAAAQEAGVGARLDAESAALLSTETLAAASSPFAVSYRFSGRTAQVHITIPDAMLNPETSEAAITPAAIYAAEIAGDEDFLDHADAIGYLPPTSCVPGVDVPDLAGYGAIAPATVRNLVSKYAANSNSNSNTGSPAGPLPKWLVISPPIDPSDPPPPAPGYRPTAELDRYVRRRDRHCQAPSCTVPALSGDVDHITPWPSGPTNAPNLHALCRRHHLQKTHGGHRITKNPDGSITWTTRAGQQLTHHPAKTSGQIVRGRTPSTPAPRDQEQSPPLQE